MKSIFKVRKKNKGRDTTKFAFASVVSIKQIKGEKLQKNIWVKRPTGTNSR